MPSRCARDHAITSLPLLVEHRRKEVAYRYTKGLSHALNVVQRRVSAQPLHMSDEGAMKPAFQRERFL